ncbi:MAG: helix-turn-helix domain-containing protein [Candidatus Cloacimonetes bacterium]|nr:helix-turn-helix domain-containing protein [Candidatus Cloacimonadota bacterium]
MTKVKNSDFQKPYISLEEASEYLSLKKLTLYSYTSKNVLPYYKIRRKILFKVSELNEFIENNRVKSNAEIETEALTKIFGSTT